jgi:hypothetical protein
MVQKMAENGSLLKYKENSRFMQEKIALHSQNGTKTNKYALNEHNAEFSNVISGGKCLPLGLKG